MKLTKTIIIGVAICLIVELAGFLYVDKIFLRNESKVKIESNSSESKVEVKPDIKVLIPNEAKNISMSFDGKYISYLTNEQIIVIDTDNEEQINIPHDNEGSKPFYKWLNDRNRIIIVEKQNLNTDIDPEQKNCSLKFYYYDLENREKVLPDTSFADPVYFDKSIEVSDLEVSTLTNLIYLKINYPGNTSSLYRYNVMLQMTNIKSNSLVGDMSLLANEDNLIYEDLTYDYIFSTGLSSQIFLPNTTKPVVLGTDNNNQIYLGQSEGNKIKKIFVGTLNQPIEEWKTYDLGGGEEKKDILISFEGRIFLNNSVLGKITDITDNNKEYFYEGRFFKLYKNGIATIINQNQFIKTDFEKLGS